MKKTLTIIAFGGLLSSCMSFDSYDIIDGHARVVTRSAPTAAATIAPTPIANTPAPVIEQPVSMAAEMPAPFVQETIMEETLPPAPQVTPSQHESAISQQQPEQIPPPTPQVTPSQHESAISQQQPEQIPPSMPTLQPRVVTHQPITPKPAATIIRSNPAQTATPAVTPRMITPAKPAEFVPIMPGQNRGQRRLR